MKRSDGADPVLVLAAVNESLDTGWQLVRPLGGSNEGAFLVERAPGARGAGNPPRAVLKWHSAGSEDLTGAAHLVALARSRAWPTPEWYAVGRAPAGQPWLLQEHVTGARPAVLDEHVATRMIDVLERQRGIVVDGTGSWADWVESAVFEDGEQLRRRVLPLEGGRHLVAQVDLVAGTCAGTRTARTDLVHGDFSLMNVLATELGLRVIDVADLDSGPVSYDLAKTLTVAAVLDHATDAATARLWAHVERLDPREFALCAAACALKTAEAVVRHAIHDRAALHLYRVSTVLDRVHRLLRGRAG